MNNLHEALDSAVPLQGLLGYLNFSTGRPDAKFQKAWNDAYTFIAEQTPARPWETLRQAFAAKLEKLHQSGTAAFGDVDQARHVLHLIFDRVVPAYRQHHRDLLFHLGEDDFYSSFFLVRVAEAVLSQRGPWEEVERIERGALQQLNDFVGHRPVAVLENERRGEIYDHERVRPVPLYLKSAGVAHGRYRDLVSHALDILQATNTDILQDASFDPALLDELAFDPRGYDFGHPVEKRTNYCYGEWDPHHLDNLGRFRRFVVRRELLEGLLDRVKQSPLPSEEAVFEAAAVLAVLILMSAGVSGSTPTTHESNVNLGNLVQRVAKFREAFYKDLLERQTGPRQKRLQQEAKQLKQPFAGVRQHINRFFAHERAFQIQQRHLALFFAEMGYAYAAKRQVEGLAVASVRILTELHIRLTTGNFLVERGDLEEAAKLLPEIEDLLHRGIHCGALLDPWNILGFQGQFPRFVAMEDSVRDPRVDDLTRILDRLFNLYAKLLSEGAVKDFNPGKDLAKHMSELADWWDRFATTTVSDVPHVHGKEVVASAGHVAKALGRWRERGANEADLAFWRQQLDGFRSPKSFALVIDALLGKHDFQAAMSLLLTWLSQAEEVPLEEGDHSFHSLALRWIMGVYEQSGVGKEGHTAALAVLEQVAKFFDYLEVNAEDFWEVPRLLRGDPSSADGDDKRDEPEDLYSAAYDEMTYQDSTDDDNEGAVLDFSTEESFDLAEEGPRLEKRLQFLSTVARLWNIGSRIVRHTTPTDRPRGQEIMRSWLEKARGNFRQLLGLLDDIHEDQIPKPSGSYESMMEYDRRRGIKENLLNHAITTCLEQHLAAGALRGVLDDVADDEEDTKAPPWEPLVLQLGRALLAEKTEIVRAAMPEFLEKFQTEPLLYTPLNQGGHPRLILRASLAQRILQALVANLPRQGLLIETYQLLQVAQQMEQNQTIHGPRVTEFDRLYQLAVQAVAEAVVDSGLQGDLSSESIVEAFDHLLEPFISVWNDHSQTLRVAMLENIGNDREWTRLREFFQEFGKELFHGYFLALGNLRGVLHQGIESYLEYLRQEKEDLKLLDKLDNGWSREEVERILQLILQTLIENYDHYRDYQATTTQADSGENLHQLFDFLRLKASYDRQAWQLRPLILVHEILARLHGPTAAYWREKIQEFTRGPAQELLEQLAKLEKKHGMRLITIRDRLEEQFVQPLAIDRLSALVEPAVEAAQFHLDDPELLSLEIEMKPFTENPTGVGLDVPVWISRLEDELDRVETSRTALVTLAEHLFQVPKLIVPMRKLLEQVAEWQPPAEDADSED